MTDAPAPSRLSINDMLPRGYVPPVVEEPVLAAPSIRSMLPADYTPPTPATEVPLSVTPAVAGEKEERDPLEIAGERFGGWVKSNLPKLGEYAKRCLPAVGTVAAAAVFEGAITYVAGTTAGYVSLALTDAALVTVALLKPSSIARISEPIGRPKGWKALSDEQKAPRLEAFEKRIKGIEAIDNIFKQIALFWGIGGGIGIGIGQHFRVVAADNLARQDLGKVDAGLSSGTGRGIDVTNVEKVLPQGVGAVSRADAIHAIGRADLTTPAGGGAPSGGGAPPPGAVAGIDVPGARGHVGSVAPPGAPDSGVTGVTIPGAGPGSAESHLSTSITGAQDAWNVGIKATDSLVRQYGMTGDIVNVWRDAVKDVAEQIYGTNIPSTVDMTPAMQQASAERVLHTVNEVLKMIPANPDQADAALKAMHARGDIPNLLTYDGLARLFQSANAVLTSLKP